MRVPNVPANARAATVRRRCCPIPASLSHTSVFGTAPKLPDNSCHIPASRSPVVRDGSNTAAMNPEYAATMVSTGGAAQHPPPPARSWAGTTDHTARSPQAGTRSGRPGPTARTTAATQRPCARSTDADRVHPIRSAITVAGIVGVFDSNARICGSNASTADPARSTLILRRPIRGQRRPHRVPRHPQLTGDRLDRHLLRLVQPSDLGPILHADHSLTLTEGVNFRSAPGGQYSGGIDSDP